MQLLARILIKPRILVKPRILIKPRILVEHKQHGFYRFIKQKSVKFFCCCCFLLLFIIVFLFNQSDIVKSTSKQNYSQNNQQLFYASLKADATNLRKGPGIDYPIILKYKKKYLPVEIIAEYYNWWRIRDNEGNLGWIHKLLISRKKRTALVSPWAQNKYQALYGSDKKKHINAWLEKKLLVHIISCSGKNCRVKSSGYDGYIKQELLWGVYPEEIV